MKFIEDHAPHPIERGIALQAPQEEAVGDHFHLGAAADRLPRAGITDARADVFSKALGKTGGGRFGGQSPRLDHPDFLMIFKNALAFRQGSSQRQGDPCGLARSTAVPGAEPFPRADRSARLLQQGVDRELAQRGVAARLVRFIRPNSTRLLMAPTAANSRTSGPMETTREAMKTFLKAGLIPV